MSRPSEAEGTIAPGFEPVREAFEHSLPARDGAGAAFCAFHEGEKVADLWGGNARSGVAWSADTLVPVFSTGKGALAIALATLVERGLIDVTRPVTDYWPEFGSKGKESITVEQVLTHTSGVVSFDGYTQVVEDPRWWLDLDAIAGAFATAEPSWPPGTRHGYHGASIGLIANEVVRRAVGTTVGLTLKDEIAGPRGIDVWIGLPSEHHHRVAGIIDADEPTDPTLAAYLSLFTPEHLQGRAHLMTGDGILALASRVDDPVVWPAEFPSAAIASARGVASLYDLMAGDGTSVISSGTLRRFVAERVRGPDHVLLVETAFGLVFMRPSPFVQLGPSPSAFGHGGLGGSGGFADPDRRVAVGYATNQLAFAAPGETTRLGVLVDALYSGL